MHYVNVCVTEQFPSINAGRKHKVSYKYIARMGVSVFRYIMNLMLPFRT